MLFEAITTISSGLFAGASIYINLVEHPARMECGARLAIKQFAPSYRRATVMQASLAITGFVAAVATWLANGAVWWLVGGIMLIAVVPFTFIAIFPTNKKLLDSSLDGTSERATALLLRWGRLHSVRSLLSLVAFVIFIILLTRN